MRAMRILVMFDLPTGTKSGRRAYAEFRKFLIEDGYYIEQFSVYTREVLGRDSMNTHLDRLRNNLPPMGSVTAISLTEKQYADRMILLQAPNARQTLASFGSQLTLSF